MIRLDQVIFSTQHEAYKNYLSPTGNISIPADVMPDGTTNDYSVVIPYRRAGTRADIYLDGNNAKVLANAATRLIPGEVYQFKSTETFGTFITYTSADITITASIFNGTGASITLIPQTIIASVVQYDAPITAI